MVWIYVLLSLLLGILYNRYKSYRELNDNARAGGAQYPPGRIEAQMGWPTRTLQNIGSLLHWGTSVDVPSDMLARVVSDLEKYIATTKATGDDSYQQFQHLLSMDFATFIAKSKAENEHRKWYSEYQDKQVKLKHKASQNNPVYCERLANRRKLPTMKYSEKICETLAAHQVLLIVGSTGCGKTTQVPQILLDAAISDGNCGKCHIVCTQPRRISAIAVAERVAYERAERLGNSVGYQIRLESIAPRNHAAILYCTTGVMLQKLQSDPLMYGISVLVLDEIHERSVETDILMGLLKKILPHRPDLKLILMSATVREQDFCDYFENCPLLRIEGVSYPVEELYLEDVLQETKYTGFLGLGNVNQGSRYAPITQPDNFDRNIVPYVWSLRGKYDDSVLHALLRRDSEGCENIEFIKQIIYYICTEKPEGAILVFMPGYAQISKLFTALNTVSTLQDQLWQSQFVVLPLHSTMSKDDQQAIFQRPPAGKRKVIISTILAETSVTIDDVVYVINPGRTKVSKYDYKTNIQTLDEVWVTKANTQQRKGRAGRVQPGICYNLFTRAREATMSDMPIPQILCNRLDSIVLSLKSLYISDPYEFLQTLLSAPDPEAIHHGIMLLKRIEALDEHGVLTPLGKHLARMPIEPQMGKMILMSALFRCLDPITTAAAVLSFKSPFYTPFGQETKVNIAKQKFDCNMHSDHLMVHNALVEYRKVRTNQQKRSFCSENFLTKATLHELERMKQQFADQLFDTRFLDMCNCRHELSNVKANVKSLNRAIIAAGLYPNVSHLSEVLRRPHKQLGWRIIHNMQTENGERCDFYPSTVNSGKEEFEFPFFVYLQKQKSKKLYLLDSTMVFPRALLIFGGEVETGRNPNNVPYISVGKAFKFKCNQETADVLLKLRWHLQHLLATKVINPAPISSEEEYLFTAIERVLALDEPVNDPVDFNENTNDFTD